MKTRALALSFLLLVGCAANPADQTTTARVETPAATTAAAPPTGEATPAPGGETPAAAGQVYLINPSNSKVDWVGSKVTRSHDGGFNQFTGEIVLVDNDPTKSTVRVEIDTDSIHSDDEKLTAHLKTPDFFDVAQYPTATFTSTKIEKVGDQYEITGDLNLHGVTKTVTFPAAVNVEPDAVTAKAEFDINRRDWNINYSGVANDLIRDEVVLRFDLRATPGTPASPGAPGVSPGVESTPATGAEAPPAEPAGVGASPEAGGTPAADGSPAAH